MYDIKTNKALSAIEKLSKSNLNTGAEFCMGTVKTIDPLSIEVDEKQILPESFFIIPSWFKKVKCRYGENGEWRNLYFPEIEINERLLLLAVNNHQKFWIMDRVYKEDDEKEDDEDIEDTENGVELNNVDV